MGGGVLPLRMMTLETGLSVASVASVPSRASVASVARNAYYAFRACPSAAFRAGPYAFRAFRAGPYAFQAAFRACPAAVAAERRQNRSPVVVEHEPVVVVAHCPLDLVQGAAGSC